MLRFINQPKSSAHIYRMIHSSETAEPCFKERNHAPKR